jgi:cytochrome c-type biogenesis protein CcmF
MEIQYIGEHLIWGQLGHVFTILSFCGALLAALAYGYSTAETNLAEQQSWKKLARWGFYTHSFAVIGIIGCLFWMLFNHYFEYHYVWQHSNSAMPMQYILSCFWEGQEGSFLLWTFWNMVLGNLLMRTAKEWEPHSMGIVAMVQCFLASMLLGVYIGDTHIGSSPFLLLREHPEFRNLPFVQSAEYLKSLDGRGLNPLLQNWWMTIHPPTLFLGFSATLFPFAFALAGLWRKEYRAWIKPALPWTFFGICILGTGILMGGAWAYESLSFGGFWAWDPVENASLVPWLTFVAGGHVMLVNQRNGQSLVTAIFLIFISFILILYSTFLTRSGILGESSVHAFTDLGMSGQLLVYLFFFVWLPSAFVLSGRKLQLWLGLSLGLFVLCLFMGFMKLVITGFLLAALIITFRSLHKKINSSPEAEEDISSREFWMFVGALVLLISSFQITFSTSTPVINKFLAGNLASLFEWLNGIWQNEVFSKLAGAKLAPQKDVIAHFNAWQIPFAILTALLVAVGQFLKYRKTDTKQLLKSLAISLGISLVLTLILAAALDFGAAMLNVLLFASIWAVCSNLDYLVRVLKGKIPKAGSSIAHIGFGLILLGALISTGKKEFISKNSSPFDLGKDFPNNENILLARNDTVKMGDYRVVYRGDSASGINIYYNVDYFTLNEKGKMDKAFTLHPFIQTNPRMGNVAEPSTKHFLQKDIFTHVTYAKAETAEEKAKAENGWQEATDHTMKPGDTVFTSNSMVILQQIVKEPKIPGTQLQNGDIAVGAELKVMKLDGRTDVIMPAYLIRGMTTASIDTVLEASGLKFNFWKIDPESGVFHIKIAEKASNAGDFIILKAIIFPGINLLWTGCILMAIGTALAVWVRIRKRAKSSETD